MNTATGNSVCVSTASRSWLVCISRPFAGNGTAQSVPVDRTGCPSIREGLGGTRPRQAPQVFPQAGGGGDRAGTGGAVR